MFCICSTTWKNLPEWSYRWWRMRNYLLLKEVPSFYHRFSSTCKEKKKTFQRLVIISEMTSSLFSADWKWIQHGGTCIPRTWNSIHPVGRNHGCGAKNWCPMGYVQANRCSRSSGKWIRLFWINLLDLILLGHPPGKFKFAKNLTEQK